MITPEQQRWLDVETAEKEEDVPATDHSNAQQFVNLDAEITVLHARRKAIEAELHSKVRERFRIVTHLRNTVSEENKGRAFHVASNPNLVVVMRWFPNCETTVEIVELVSP